MSPRELFTKATVQAGTCVRRVEPGELHNPTPCREWNVRALLNHMIYELSWASEILGGKTIAEVGGKYDGDLLGNDAPAAWKQATRSALTAVQNANANRTVHLSYGDRSTEHYIRELASDMLIHGWDVAQALHCSIVFEPDLAQAIYDFASPRQAEFQASGLFDRVVPTKATDSLQTKLLALYGRQVT